MNPNILEAEFFDEIKERADTKFQGRLHEAFVDWFVEAEFGDNDWAFTDGPSDAGIDAIVWCPDDTPQAVIIQSKFTANFAKTSVSKKAYREFQDVIDAFRFGEDRFDTFLESAQKQLRRRYRQAQEKLAESSWHHGKKAFRFISTQRGRKSLESANIQKGSYLYFDQVLELYKDYRQAHTPRARDLVLRLQPKLSYEDRKNGFRSYLFSADVSDFRRYLIKNDVARLVARNVRYDIGNKKLGGEIRKSYEKKPSDFWYLHNGITILCDNLTEEGNDLVIANPSVVNGAQTLYSIAESANLKSTARVTVRVIRRPSNHRGDENDPLLQRIIRGVNSQNDVKEYDLRSNDPEQVLLQKKFREMLIFYERKRGEWNEFKNQAKFKKFARLRMTRLAQIASCCADSDGDGLLLVKKGTEELFKDGSQHSTYRRLFPSAAAVARRFKRFYILTRLYWALEEYGYRNKQEARERQHGFWNCIWLLGMMVGNEELGKLEVLAIASRFDQLGGANPHAKSLRKQLRRLTEECWKVWAKFNRRDPIRWTPNNFFKSRAGTAQLRKVVLKAIKADFKKAYNRFLAT